MEEKNGRALALDENCFDIIRLLCAGTVFLGHFITHFQVDVPALFTVAYFIRGVPVFYMLSGFFIAASLEKYSTREFYIRRFFRIYPSLWLCIFVNFAIILSVYTVPKIMDLILYFFPQLTIAQFYTPEWLRGYGVGTPNGVLWTISVDIQYYVIAVLLAKVMKGRKKTTWLLVTAVCAACSWGLRRAGSLLPVMVYKVLSVAVIPSYLYIFLFGMMLYYHRDFYIPALAKHWRGICLLYIVWSFLVPEKIRALFEGVQYNVITTLLLMCMTMSVGYAFGRRRMKHDYSYGFYLYHMVVINFIYHVFLQDISSVPQFFLVIIIAAAGAAILGYVLQIQFDKRVVKRWQNRVLGRCGL